MAMRRMISLLLFTAMLVVSVARAAADMPTSAPTITCIDCSNEEPDNMAESGITCKEAEGSVSKKCNEKENWVKNKWCQRSCYKAGRGYDGDVCCGVRPPSNVQGGNDDGNSTSASGGDANANPGSGFDPDLENTLADPNEADTDNGAGAGSDSESNTDRDADTDTDADTGTGGNGDASASSSMVGRAYRPMFAPLLLGLVPVLLRIET